MRIALLLAMILATAAFASPVLATQVVWKWVDSQGVTHYADRPVPGAERVELSSGTTSSYSSPPPSSASRAPSKSADTGPEYRNVEIWKPANDEVFSNVGGSVDVNVRVEPQLQPGHTLSLYLDGRLVEGYPPETQQFSLKDVFRGTHQVVAVIIDQSGQRVVQTDPVTFHVRQTSVLNPQNGQRRTTR